MKGYKLSFFFIILIFTSMGFNLHSSSYFEEGRQVTAFSTNNSASSHSFEMNASPSTWRMSSVGEKTKIVPYGKDNLHPLRLREIQRKSLQHSNIVSIASSLIGGAIKHKIKGKEGDLSNQDEARLKEVQVFYEKANILNTHADRSYNLYSYGYAPVLMNWKLGRSPKSGVFAVSQRDAIDFRLGRHINTFFGLECNEHYYHYDWKTVEPSGELGAIKELTPKAYFKLKKIDHSKVLKIKRFRQGVITEARGGMFSHMIGMPKRSNKFYPRPFFESDVFWHKAYGEIELTTVERNGVKNGLRTDYIITVFRSVYDNPEGTTTEQIKTQKQLDLKRIQGEYAGYINSGRTQVNFMGITYEGEIRETDGNIKVDPIPNNNNFTEIGARQSSLDRYIRSAHSLTVPELAGLNDSKTGFSNIAEVLRVGAEVYIGNVIMPHIEKIDEWHNTIINANNGFNDIETFTEPRVIALKALISEFKELLTINEFRQRILSMGPLDKEEKEDLIGSKANNNTSKGNAQETTVSVNDKTIEKIAFAVKEAVTTK